uniref:Uncharacterized protein n=1 Tax=Rhizophora mucronata TaxID=61149 RepID=A0A2P2MVY0_RHIMU
MNLVYGMDESSHAEDLEDKKGADLNKNEFDFTNVHFLFPKMFFYPLDLGMYFVCVLSVAIVLCFWFILEVGCISSSVV